MPPRTAKKSPVKKPSAKSKNPVSATESSPADALTYVAEETTPEPEALSILQDKDASEADAVNDDVLTEGETSPAPAMVEEPAEPIGEDSIIQSELEEPLQDEHVELEHEQAHMEVDEGKSPFEEPLQDEHVELEHEQEQMEADEGVKETDVKVNTIDEVDYVDASPDDAEVVDGDDDKTTDTDGDNEENEDNDHTMDLRVALGEGKKQKESKIYVGGLDKDAVEEDLIKVFGVFGDIQSVRIVRNPITKKSKGFAFICFANSEHAMKALADLADGTEIKGKHVRIQASQDDATLYLGNISKTWTRDNVIERLKRLGVEQFDNMILPSDPKDEGKIRGFAFLEFNSHTDANVAFQRLRKPDADFGRKRTAKVAFAHTALHPSEDDMLQVKTVYFDGIPLSWDEEKVKEICKEYGQIERVLLSRNFSSRRRKDFGFVEFYARESALACVEGINKTQIADGDAKVVANLARPIHKGRLVKQGSKGGFKTKNDGETIQEAGGIAKKRKASEEILLKGKKQNTKIAKVNKASSSEKIDSKGKNGLQATMSIKRIRKNNSGKILDTGRSSRKMLQNRRYSNRNRNSTIREATYGAHISAYPGRYEPQLRPSDLVPHAGYLPTLKQGTSTYEHDRRRSGTYNSELRSTYVSGRAISGLPASYHSDYSSYQGDGHRNHSRGPYAPRGSYYY